MPPRLSVPKFRTSCTMEYSTYAKVKETAEYLHKTHSEVIEMALLSGMEVITMALDPKNATFLKKMGETYLNDPQTH